MNSLSTANQQYIQKVSANKVGNMASNGNNIQSPTKEPMKDTFIKTHKKELAFGGIVCAVGLLGGFFALGKKGLLGENIQNFINKTFFGGNKTQSGTKTMEFFQIKDGKKVKLNSKGKTFLDANGNKVSALTLENGIFYTKDGREFNGIMQCKDKNGVLIQNTFEDGMVTRVETNGILSRTKDETGITYYNKQGELTQRIYKDRAGIRIKKYNEGVTTATTISKDKGFVQINTISDDTNEVTAHKLFDTKTGKLLQEGHFDKNTKAYGEKGGIVVQDGDTKYIFHRRDTRGLFQYIHGENVGAPNKPAIEQTLPNGVIKIYNPYGDFRQYGFVFPTGEEIFIGQCNGFVEVTENVVNGTSSILDGIDLPKDIKKTKISAGALIEAGHKHPLKEQEKANFIELYSKFIPDEKYSKLYSPLEAKEDIIGGVPGIGGPEHCLTKEVIEFIADSPYANYNSWNVEHILDFFRKQGM